MRGKRCTSEDFKKYLNSIPEPEGLRDQFAGQFLQGMAAGFHSVNAAHGWTPEEIAKECYAYADAMLRERVKR